MDDYEESYLKEIEKEIDEIRDAALEAARRSHPGIEAVIDRRTTEDYCERIWDYPGKWYPYFKLPDGFESKEELILAMADETVRYFQNNGDARS